ANSNAISQNVDTLNTHAAVINNHADVIDSNSAAIADNANAIVSLDGRVNINTSEIEEMKFGLNAAGLLGNGEEEAASTTGVGSTAVGHGATARTRDTAVGYRATVTADGSVALGAETLVEAENSVALGADAHVTANGVGSVALGQASVADEPNVVSVGSASNQRRITQVADGVNAHDAVNVRQLQQVYATTSNRIDRLDQRVKDLRKESFAGIASVAALAAIPDPKAGRKNSLGVGYGNYKGENALAIGFKSDVSENLRLTTGVATARDDLSANIGLGWSW
ncbi:MAG: YadA-like family protein, partial [Desulfuromonadales bacterium]|nr:YadA-like family protein [Desulfuromonadales bacterium]